MFDMKSYTHNTETHGALKGNVTLSHESVLNGTPSRNHH